MSENELISLEDEVMTEVISGKEEEDAEACAEGAAAAASVNSSAEAESGTESSKEKSEAPEKEEKPVLVLPKDEDFYDVDSGDALKDATEKLLRERLPYESVPEGMPYQILTWLITQLPGDPVLCQRILWKHKTYDRCAEFIYSKAAEICYEQMKKAALEKTKLRDFGQSISVNGETMTAVGFSMANDITYCHAIEYYRIDDLEKVKEEAVRKAKEEYNRKTAKGKAAAAKAKTPAKPSKKETKKPEPEKKEAPPATPQLSMFDLLEE